MLFGLKTGEELVEEYKVSIVNHSLFWPCSKWCVCGHHICYHKWQGSMGVCLKCKEHNGHNFNPRDAISLEWSNLDKYIAAISQIKRVEQ